MNYAYPSRTLHARLVVGDGKEVRLKINKKRPLSAEVLQPRDNETLAQYLRYLRFRRGLTPEAVADATTLFPSEQQISSAYLCQFELGHAASPSLEQLRGLALVLEIPEDWLIQKTRLNAVQPESGQPALSIALATECTLRAAEPDAREQEQIRRIIKAIRDAHFSSQTSAVAPDQVEDC